MIDTARSIPGVMVVSTMSRTPMTGGFGLAAYNLSRRMKELGNGEFYAEIAVTEQELRAVSSKRGTQDAFVRFAELQLVDLAKVWQIAAPDKRERVQNLLFEGGLHCSLEAGILNRSKSSLFSMLEAMTDERGLLAFPKMESCAHDGPPWLRIDRGGVRGGNR